MEQARKVIFGAGGVARELAWMLADPATLAGVDAFIVPDEEWREGQSLDGVALISEAMVAERFTDRIQAFVAIGLPAARRVVHAKFGADERFVFPSFVHPAASLDRRNGKTSIGQGVILYPLASLTTGVTLGDFVQVNPCATLGHGARIGRYSTICPGANISGEATIGERCFVGAGAVVKEGVRIADGCMIGAGAVVVRDIGETGTWIGVPARKQGA